MTRVCSKTLNTGRLLAVAASSRFLLAKCTPSIEVHSHEKQMKLHGRNVEYTVKSCDASIILCADMEFTQKVDTELLGKISRFDLRISYIREDGDALEKVFGDIIPVEIDLNGVWKFDATGHLSEITYLFPDLNFG